MRLRDFHGFALALLLAGSAAAATVDFDDRAGKPGPFTGSCAAEFQVDDEYALLGIQFSSSNLTEPVCVLASGSSAPSPPNVVSGMTAGNIDFGAPIIATFEVGGQPAAVASLSLALPSSTTPEVTVSVFDVGGALLGSRTGPGTHFFSFPQRIHSVRIDNGFVAADTFSFTTPGPPHLVPGLPLAARLLMFALLAAVGLRGLRRIG